MAAVSSSRVVERVINRIPAPLATNRDQRASTYPLGGGVQWPHRSRRGAGAAGVGRGGRPRKAQGGACHRKAHSRSCCWAFKARASQHTQEHAGAISALQAPAVGPTGGNRMHEPCIWTAEAGLTNALIEAINRQAGAPDLVDRACLYNAGMDRVQLVLLESKRARAQRKYEVGKSNTVLSFFFLFFS